MIISKRHKVDVGLVARAMNNTNATGRYYGAGMWRRFLALLNVGTMAAGTTATIDLLQATSAAGAGSKAVVGATATVTANTNVTAAQVVVGAPANGATLTVNGLVFTKAAATTVANREFADAAGVATVINDATYGVAGVTAANNAGTVSLEAADPGEKTLTLASSDAASLTCSTTQAVAYLELDVSRLDLAGGFEYVAIKVTTTANSVVSAGLFRGEGRYSPVQAVGASAVV